MPIFLPWRVSRLPCKRTDHGFDSRRGRTLSLTDKIRPRNGWLSPPLLQCSVSNFLKKEKKITCSRSIGRITSGLHSLDFGLDIILSLVSQNVQRLFFSQHVRSEIEMAISASKTNCEHLGPKSTLRTTNMTWVGWFNMTTQ